MGRIEDPYAVIEDTLGNVNTNDEVAEIRRAVQQIKENMEEQSFNRPDDGFEHEEHRLIKRTVKVGEVRGYRVMYTGSPTQEAAFNPDRKEVNTVIDVRYRARLPESMVSKFQTVLDP